MANRLQPAEKRRCITFIAESYPEERLAHRTRGTLSLGKVELKVCDALVPAHKCRDVFRFKTFGHKHAFFEESLQAAQTAHLRNPGGSARLVPGIHNRLDGGL